MITKLKEFFRRKPKVWFSSDFHFGHKNVIHYCNRPWKTIDEMTDGLIKIWNTTVKKHDTVYFIGDFSLNPKWSKNIVPKLNGYKILIAGNHDSVFYKPTQLPRYLNEWNEVHMTREITLSNNQKVLLSHLPYANEDSLKYDDRYLHFRPKNNGLYLICGHLHGRFLKSGRMIDVGIDGSLTMYSESDIIKLINDSREFIPSRLTEHYKNRKEEKYEK